MNRAQKIRGRNRRILELPGGLDLEVRIPTVLDMVEAGLDPIVASVSATDAERQAAIDAQVDAFQSDIRKFYPFATKLLALCMIDPKLHLDKDTPCPDDAVTPADLGDEVLYKATEILGMLHKEVGEAGREAARFRVDADRENGAVGSADVRDESAGHPEIAETRLP